MELHVSAADGSALTGCARQRNSILIHCGSKLAGIGVLYMVAPIFR